MSPSIRTAVSKADSIHSSIFGPLSTPVMRFSIYGPTKIIQPRPIMKPQSTAVSAKEKRSSKRSSKRKSKRESRNASSLSTSSEAEKSDETALLEKTKTKRASHASKAKKHRSREAVVVDNSTSSSPQPNDATSSETSVGTANSATTAAFSDDGKDDASRPGALTRFGHGFMKIWSKCKPRKKGSGHMNMDFESDTSTWGGVSESEVHHIADEDYDLCLRVLAEPYSWPHTGSAYPFSPETTALVIIDMQKDFLSPHGYLAQQGADIDSARAIIPQVQQLLAFCRKANFPIYHTREGHRRGLSTMSTQQKFRSRRANISALGMGDLGPLGRLLVRGEEGHDIIDELKPFAGDVNGVGEEPIIDKPARSAFNYTDFQLLLDVRGVKNLIICGVTTDQCVLSTMRDANDRGFDCLLVEDACWADPTTHTATLEMIKAEGGILGSVTTKNEVLRAIHHLLHSPSHAQEQESSLHHQPVTKQIANRAQTPLALPLTTSSASTSHLNVKMDALVRPRTADTLGKRKAFTDLRRADSRRTARAKRPNSTASIGTEYLEFYEASNDGDGDGDHGELDNENFGMEREDSDFIEDKGRR